MRRIIRGLSDKTLWLVRGGHVFVPPHLFWLRLRVAFSRAGFQFSFNMSNKFAGRAVKCLGYFYDGRQ